MQQPLTELDEGTEARVVVLDGGQNFQTKLRTIGIREGKTITLVTKHPFGGPLVVEVDRRGTTIGRGMASRIIVEVV